MSTYLVTWEIEVEAHCSTNAAKAAREIMLDPESTATVFKVAQRRNDNSGKFYSSITIDLQTRSRNPSYFIYIPSTSVIYTK